MLDYISLCYWYCSWALWTNEPVVGWRYEVKEWLAHFCFLNGNHFWCHVYPCKPHAGTTQYLFEVQIFITMSSSVKLCYCLVSWVIVSCCSLCFSSSVYLTAHKESEDIKQVFGRHKISVKMIWNASQLWNHRWIVTFSFIDWFIYSKDWFIKI